MSKKRRVLLVDDKLEELNILEQCLREVAEAKNIDLEILTAQDGNLARRTLIACLAQNHLPDLVLLDLNMPESGGFDLLVKLKTHPRLSRLCVVIFSSADHPQEIKKAYQELANGYVKKPFSLGVLIEALEGIVGFWLMVNLVDVLD